MRQRRFLRPVLPIQLRVFLAIATVSLCSVRTFIKNCIIKNFLTIQFFTIQFCVKQYLMIKLLRGGINFFVFNRMTL